MSRMYTVAFSNVSIVAQQDFFSFQPATDKPCIVHAVFISNTGGTLDAGDAQEELLQIEICRGNTTIGSGGTNPTAQALDHNNAQVFGPTTNVRVNDTTKVTAGTRATLHADGFNVRTGWQYVPTPEMRPNVKNGVFLAIQLLTTPNDAVLMSGTLYVEEF